MASNSHPAANIFPMLDDTAYEALKADIAANGLREPVVNYCGQLIDGRNRMKACKELGIEPMESELDESTDPVAYVLSVNLHRRQLRTSQKAMCAAKLAGLPNGAHGQSSANLQSLPADNAAELFGVSTRSVSSALDVLRNGSAYLIEQCELGYISINSAAKLIESCQDKKEQTRVAKSGKTAIKDAIQTQSSKPKPSADDDDEDDDADLNEAEALPADIEVDSEEPDDEKPDDDCERPLFGIALRKSLNNSAAAKSLADNQLAVALDVCCCVINTLKRYPLVTLDIATCQLSAFIADLDDGQFNREMK